jgi:hypothetical protein
MKTKILLLAISSLCLPGALAQTERPSLLKEIPDMPPEKLQRYIHFQTGTLSKVFGINVHYSGVVPQLCRTSKPWQLLNPFAPAEYGNGYDNVSIDPVTSRAEGIAIFAIRF